MARVWRGGKQVVTHHQIKEPNKIIMIAWKWEGEKETHLETWDAKQDDSNLVANFQKVAEDADIVIAHNGENFDFRHIAARLAYHSAAPLYIQNSEDTFRLIKRKLALPAYSLDYLGEYFGLGRKMSTGGLDLWIDVIEKKSKRAILKMSKYCRQDVILLEKVYNRVYNYVDHKGNYGVLNIGNEVCPHCGSPDIQKRGTRKSKVSIRQTYSCNFCCRWSSKGTNEVKNSGKILR